MNKLTPVDFDNQRVLTTEQLAEVYETDTNNIKNNFNRNKDKFTEGVHYYLLEGEALREFKREVTGSDLVAINVNRLYLWTERGASRHSKILDTDKAWEQFDNLEETYFRVKNNQISIEGVSPELQAIIMHDKKIQAVEGRVDKLENTMTVDYAQQRTLKAIGTKAVMRAIGGKDAPAYKEISRKVFAALWRDYKNYFNINSYANTPVVRFDDAINYLKGWWPDNNLNLEIIAENRKGA